MSTYAQSHRMSSDIKPILCPWEKYPVHCGDVRPLWCHPDRMFCGKRWNNQTVRAVMESDKEKFPWYTSAYPAWKRSPFLILYSFMIPRDVLESGGVGGAGAAVHERVVDIAKAMRGKKFSAIELRTLEDAVSPLSDLLGSKRRRVIRNVADQDRIADVLSKSLNQMSKLLGVVGPPILARDVTLGYLNALNAFDVKMSIEQRTLMSIEGEEADRSREMQTAAMEKAIRDAIRKQEFRELMLGLIQSSDEDSEDKIVSQMEKSIMEEIEKQQQNQGQSQSKSRRPRFRNLPSSAAVAAGMVIPPLMSPPVFSTSSESPVFGTTSSGSISSSLSPGAKKEVDEMVARDLARESRERRMAEMKAARQKRETEQRMKRERQRKLEDKTFAEILGDLQAQGIL